MVVEEFEVEVFIKYFGYILNCWNVEVSIESIIWYSERSFNYMAKTFWLDSLDFVNVGGFIYFPKLYPISVWVGIYIGVIYNYY